jgi:iron complex outermembrane recepter protein
MARISQRCRLHLPIRHNSKHRHSAGKGVGMTQDNNFTQACCAGVNSVGKPDWIGRFRPNAHSMRQRCRSPKSSALIGCGFAAFLLALVLCMGSVAYAADDSSKHFEIKAKPLADALMEFGVQSGLTVVAQTTLTAGKKAAAVRGDLIPTDALGQLLKGSGLTFARAADGTIAIQAIASNGPAQASAGRSGLDKDLTEEGGLKEVVVTAQKRNERLQDVPVPVTVLDASSLIANNELRIQDYYATVPGLSLISGGSGTQYLSIRGLITGTNNSPTVGVTIDDVPYGGSSLLGSGEFFPDLDPTDLKQIEVLKGPQGTLYGADSLGGLIKYVTQDPSSEELSGRVEATGNSVDHGDGGYGARGALNVPISDTFAVRVSGFTRRDPGYIENVANGEQEVNQTDVYGGRAAAIWRPSDSLSIKLSALLQNDDANGASMISTNALSRPTLGPLQQIALPGTGGYYARIRLYTATVNANFGGVTLTSITGYGFNQFEFSRDYSVIGSLLQPVFGVTGASESQDFPTTKWTQEFRLASVAHEQLDWMLGAFYTHEDTPAAKETYYANDPTTGQVVGTAVDVTLPYEFSEYAAFGDVTWHVTDRFDFQVGAREARNEQTYNAVATGPLTPAFVGAPSPYVWPTTNADANAFTFLVDPKFKLNSDAIVYARIASGYRVGGPNLGSLGVPVSYQPDKTLNYEVGFKGDFINHCATLDASAYYIDWRNIQLDLETPLGEGYTGNGARAKSEGIEFSFQVRPLEGMTLSAVGAVSNAVLTKDLPLNSPAYALSGDRLPFSSKFSGTLSADYDVVHVREATGFVGAGIQYVGQREGNFTSSATQVRTEMPGYSTVNLHFGARFHSWLVNAFANNITDVRGVIGTGNWVGAGYQTSPYTATITQPRTVGVSVAKSF